MNIAQSLSVLMKEQGLSSSRLARELGVHTSTVSNWLKGKEVKSDNLEIICNYFDCSMDYLAGVAETKKSPSNQGEGVNRVPDDMETRRLLKVLESREDLRYLAAAAARATPEHVMATAEMFDKLYGKEE